MANTFYFDACNVDSKMTPVPGTVSSNILDEGENASLTFHTPAGGKILLPHSIMNDNVAINYRSIINGYAPISNSADFTDFNDYAKCMKSDDFMTSYMKDKRDPSYKNIITYYSHDEIDPYGLARYKMQDFIYLKYYNQIPNNYMITLRRYTRPCYDHMFGLDMSSQEVNGMNGYNDTYAALATAVTYMGDKTGNKLSDILKFDYGANWEDKEGAVESLQNPDGGLAAQMRDKWKPGERGGKVGGAVQFAAACMGKGVSVNIAMAAENQYPGNAFSARYGDEFYGDVNVVNKVKMRSRGLTFSNNFTLTFEYSLKSLKCVNPRIAMMDILTNFLILTGNYGTFWGGATIFYGQRNIAPQYGNPQYLRDGKYGKYIQSVVGDVKEGFMKITGKDVNPDKNLFQGIWDGIKSLASGSIQQLLGSILGGKIGVAGQAVVPHALLSGEPSGFWHVTIGNPLDPIAMMGNMAVTKTTVQFSDALGYDDFPTEVKFTVDLEHCQPRDNAKIESMFNAGKGRFYAFTDGNLFKSYTTIDSLANFQMNDTMKNQEVNTTFNTANALPQSRNSGHAMSLENVKIFGGFLNG